MKRLLFAGIMAILALSFNSCKYEKTYYHNKNGKVKHVRAHKTPPWFYTKERGYSKYARQVMKRWDRSFR